MTKPVILTGLRANNDLHIGNYFGAILPIVDMAKQKSDQFQVNMFIPDLHSFTTPIDHSQLFDQTMRNAKLFVAAGLPIDNDSIQLYRQSHIPAHSELTVILNAFTGFGEMRRMTQFKERSGLSDFNAKKLARYEAEDRVANDPDMRSNVYERDSNTLLADPYEIDTRSVSVGLFNYPVLMASDILLYGAKYVPIGDDQSQHLEFTRDIAQRMNSKFGELFTVPEAVKAQHEFFGNDQGLRIKDLADPTKKMSKSDESDKGVIFLGDDPEVAAKKVMSATTDDKGGIHFDRENQPGISNLLEILALLRGEDRDKIIAEFEGQTSYGDFKKVVADAVRAFLSDFQAKLVSVTDSEVLAKLEASEEVVTKTANQTLYKVQRAVGLRPKGN